LQRIKEFFNNSRQSEGGRTSAARGKVLKLLVNKNKKTLVQIAFSNLYYNKLVKPHLDYEAYELSVKAAIREYEEKARKGAGGESKSNRDKSNGDDNDDDKGDGKKSTKKHKPKILAPLAY
jgi:phosphopantothenoylcysteine synthetase/decarboxylase